MGKLASQALDLVGKDWSHGSLTREKNLGNIERLCDLVEEKYNLENIQDLKTNHLEGAFQELRDRELAVSTLGAYATAARTIADGIGKQNIMPRENSHEMIQASRAGERLKPMDVDREALAEKRDQLYEKAEWLGLAQDLRTEFGLRAKESLLSNQTVEKEGKTLLQVEGAKGGKPRELEVRTEGQREAMAAVKNYLDRTGQRSIIPPDKTLKQAYNYQKNTLYRMGATKANRCNAHAARHARLQDMRKEGASRKEVSREAGHEREYAASHYTK